MRKVITIRFFYVISVCVCVCLDYRKCKKKKNYNYFRKIYLYMIRLQNIVVEMNIIDFVSALFSVERKKKTPRRRRR